MRGAVLWLICLGWVACDDAASGITDLGPEAPACLEPEIVEKKAACERFRDVLCRRLAEDCDAFPDLDRCREWFTAQYGNCDEASGSLPSREATAMRECLCELPRASCQALQEMGAEGAVSACAEW